MAYRPEIRSQESGGRDQETEVRSQGTEIADSGSKIVDEKDAPESPSPNQQSSILNLSRQSAAATDHQSLPLHLPLPLITAHCSLLTAHCSPLTAHCSLLTAHSLSFDHTEFRDSSGKTIHAFKGVWVSGASTILGDGLRGGAEQWRQIRWRAALKRFRPAHARVAQGAVRGIANPDRAWEIFEESMLRDLIFER